MGTIDQPWVSAPNLVNVLSNLDPVELSARTSDYATPDEDRVLAEIKEWGRSSRLVEMDDVIMTYVRNCIKPGNGHAKTSGRRRLSAFRVSGNKSNNVPSPGQPALNDELFSLLFMSFIRLRTFFRSAHLQAKPTTAYQSPKLPHISAMRLGSLLPVAPLLLSGVLAQNDTFFNLTAIAVSANTSVLECWQLINPFVISDAPGTAGSATLQFGDLANATYTVLPPRFNGGLHRAPHMQ